DVGAGDERALAFAREDDDADARVVAEIGERRQELLEQRGVERVQDVGAVDRDRGDALVDRDAKAGAAHPATFSRRKSTISAVGAPGVKTSATPRPFSSSTSSPGMVPPTTTTTSPAPCSFSRSRMRGTSVMWAPDRIEIPTASASSWVTVATICSGVWWRPVQMTSIPASRSDLAMILAPRSWPSRPGFATTTRMGPLIAGR